MTASGSAEIELKLGLAPAAMSALLRHPAVAAARRGPLRRAHVVSTYFDTPDRALATAGIALRVRRDGRRWLQTVKGPALPGAGGTMHVRREDEWPLAGPALDATRFGETPWRKALDRAWSGGALAARFTTDFVRRTLPLELADGSFALLCIDHGHIGAGRRRMPIAEIELELEAGAPAALIAFARTLAADLPLVVGLANKAERGDALARRQPALGAPLHASALPAAAFPARLDAATALARVAANCVAQIAGNAAGLVAATDPEWVHQMRVGTRRLRACLALAAPVCARQPTAQTRALPTEAKAWKGDFDGMLARRHVRVLVPYSRTLFFNDKGRERGLTAETARAFEQYLNKKYAAQLGKRPLTLYLVPTTRDELLEDVAKGVGDIAAGNLTVTDARRQIVDFVAPPDAKPNREIVLGGAKAEPLATAEALSGKTVHVRWTSSYHDSLVALNQRLASDGKPAVKLVAVPDELEDEDMMEMLNVGLLDYIVVDEWKAKMWAQVLPKMTLNEGAVLRESGQVGWAIRKGSPKLAAELNEFYANHLKKLGVANYLRQQHSKRIKALRDAGTDADAQRFNELLVLFQKYGAKYNFDPLMLAAQGYQESQLNQQAKSHVGAIGVMQIMPATGAELKVGDIRVTEANIHGGAKYMDQLMTHYFKDVDFSPANRALFAFASYNAGPGNIARMRKEAEKRGLDPDRWFNNVELVTAEKIGIETTTYVRNIFKYYTSYKLTLDARKERDKARGELPKK